MEKRKLKIAHIAPISERVPPKKYGGIERVVDALTEELVRRGHDVTLFATGDSLTSAKLESIVPRGLREMRVKDPHGLNEWTLLHILNAYKKQSQFDIIHDENSIFSLSTVQFSKTPTVVTLHGPINSNNKRLYQSVTNTNFVGISRSQTANFPEIKMATTIHNGLDMEGYPHSDKPDDYLLYVGRLSMEKGVHHAIDAAVDLNMKLVLAAKLDQVDEKYFEHEIEPRLDGEQIKWVGEVDETERNRLMSKALAFLHPVTWREPFGLTIIEAMACECPVIGFNKGSIPELVVDGKTGYVVSDTDEMINAITKLDRIDRRECRRHSLKNFNSKLMADRYEELYYKVIDTNPRGV